MVRNAAYRSAVSQMGRERPREPDAQVVRMKGDLEGAVAHHRGM